MYLSDPMAVDFSVVVQFASPVAVGAIPPA